ncbi:hypothetical protein GF1_31330 [Desulfolithobacter dissulfuricans]|uniref:Zinc resistance-associated protein n=1 Tax=Desulfolithobacter dissulfuricans TaxID=2795293 RepID=A0A915U4E5_9BACT|nr:hypothetical protein [Desulfolithobacter dissulfuricans]BCO10757.1 hypothetical protein GF1_31330 [Desulfolithobacter dissulfuricans]
MKKVTKKTVITSILALGLAATTALAQPFHNTDHNSGSGQPLAQRTMMGMGPGMMVPGMMGGQWHRGGMGMGCNPMMGGGMMGMMGPGMMGGLQQKFLDQTVDLRKQMMEKRFEYMEALRKPDTKPQDLAAIEKDMLDLRTRMMEQMNSLQER